MINIPRLSLRSALILQVALPLCILLALATSVSINVIEHHTRQRLEDDVQLVARAVRIPLGYDLQAGHYEQVKRSLYSVFKINRIFGAYVYDMKGKRIAAVGAVEPRANNRHAAALASTGKRQGRFQSVQGRRVYSYFLPLLNDSGQIDGLLQVVRRRSDFVASANRLRWRIGFGLAGVLAVALILILLGHNRAIGRHLTWLTRSMARVESGERKHRTQASGPREVAALGRALNNMLDGIGRAEQEVQQRRDVQAQLETRLRQSEKMAAIGRLAAGVAHELGTPLSVIDGRARQALKEPVSARQRRALAAVRREVDHMTMIVQQLLHFGRAHDSRQRVIAPTTLIRDAVAAVQEEARRVHCRVRITAPHSEAQLRVDPVRLHMALANLLRNAVQVSPGGEVKVSFALLNMGVVFIVEDQGPGVPENLRRQIFEPFFTTKDVGQGSGLGLAVVHSVAREHGGSAYVASRDRTGARFVIELPAQALARPAAQTG